jgi:hypothetical protein
MNQLYYDEDLLRIGIAIVWVTVLWKILCGLVLWKGVS